MNKIYLFPINFLIKLLLTQIITIDKSSFNSFIYYYLIFYKLGVSLYSLNYLELRIKESQYIESLLNFLIPYDVYKD